MVPYTLWIELAFVGLVVLSHAGGLGVVRLLLAMFVVGSHVGAIGWTSSGGVGIGGFFAISGFLMARTIAANYAGTGFGRFYVNRFIRLAPPLMAVMALTVVLILVRDGEGFRIKAGSSGQFMPVDLPKSLFHWFDWNPQPYPVLLAPSFNALPQAWSLVTESCFYLVAPLAAWLLGRRAAAIVAIAAAASAALAVQAASAGLDAWMRSPLASFWIFALGMLTFQWRRRTPLDGPSARRLHVIATALVGCIFLLTFHHVPVRHEVVLLVTPLLMLAWLWLTDASGRVPARWGNEAGNWAYGVFLAHFLSTLTMYWIAEAVFRATGVFGLFGEPDRTDLRLAFCSYLFALLFGIGIYHLVERPFERLRAVIRRRTWRRGVLRAPAQDGALP
jgi:peptidoglycan/LPS O-acetylase OafA/YrhL